MKLILHLALLLVTMVLLHNKDAEAAVNHSRHTKQVSYCPPDCGNCDAHEKGSSWVGQSKRICAKITCRKDYAGQVSLGGVPCGVVGFRRGSKCQLVEGNPNAPFPACCPRVQCD